jgi:hypothetical protein
MTITARAPLPSIAPLSLAAQDYIRLHDLAALCTTCTGISIAHNPNGPVQIPSVTTSIVWCGARAAEQIVREVDKGMSIEETAAKFGIEVIEHSRLLLRAGWRARSRLFNPALPR